MMHDLFNCSAFELSKGSLNEISAGLLESNMIHLYAHADLNSIIAMAFLETAFIGKNINYSRRILASKDFLPRDEVISFDQHQTGDVVYINPHKDTEPFQKMSKDELIEISNKQVSVRIGTSKNEIPACLDVVSQSAAIAYSMDDSTRLRKLRYLVGAGQWLRESMDTTYDPIHSLIRDHLKSEGTVMVVPLPECSDESMTLIPGIPERMINRLRKKWSSMDYSQRAMAVSEITLLALDVKEISTSRLEELIWHRITNPNLNGDLASVLHNVGAEWPKGESEGRLHASEVLDSLIINSNF